MSDVITKDQVINKNAYLSQADRYVNARYIMQYFKAKGWTLNAVAGMVGNMDAESHVNPGIWEKLTVNTSRGFGLVQWTPATKLINWCEANGLDYTDIDSQLARIVYELENGLQFYKTDTYPITFKQFSTSTQSPEYLAGAFLYNYEQPAVYNTEERQERARLYYDYLAPYWDASGNDTPVEPGSPRLGRKMSMLLMYMATKRK